MKIEKLAYLLFILSNILILFNPGDFWDDWAYVSQVPERIISQFKNSGIAVFGYLFVFIQKFLFPTFLHRALTFLLQLMQIYLLFRMLEHFPLKKFNHKFLSLAILVFAVFPHYDAKITMVVFPYTLCLTFFLLASFWLVKYFNEKRNIIYRILSILFFFLSFFTNSLLFFYLIPVFFIFFFENWQNLNIKSHKSYKVQAAMVFKKIWNYLDFFMLPFLFWTVKSIYFKPSAQYKEIGYNILSVNSLPEIPARILKFLYVSLSTLYPLLKDAVQYIELWILFAILFFILYKFFIRSYLDIRNSREYFIWAILIFLAGAFPYLMVNKFPSYIHYMSRHQLLIGFGASLLLTGAILMFKSILVRSIMISGTISAFICFNIFIQFSFFKGYVKQEVIQEFFDNSNNLHRASPRTIILDDNTDDFTHKGNPTKFYAFAGMLKRKYNDENVMVVRREDLKRFRRTKILTIIGPYFANYNLSNYEFIEPDYILEVNYTEKEMPLFPMIKFYGDFMLGKKAEWSEYFVFNLRPI